MNAQQTKDIVLFVTDAHSGQLNPLLSIAKALTKKRGDLVEIHFVTNDYAKERVLAVLPAAVFVSNGIPTSLSSVVQEPGYYESKMKSPPFAIMPVFDLLVKTVVSTVGYSMLYDALSKHVATLSAKPRLAVLDGVVPAAQDCLRALDIPRITNFPFNARTVLEPNLAGFWDFPSTLTLGLVGIRFVLRRVRAANISLREALEDSLGVKGSAEYLVNTVFGFEYPFKLPDNCTMIGACFDPDEVEANFLNNVKGGQEPTMAWIEEHKTVVYIGLGTITKPSKSYTIELLRAFQRVRHEVPDVHLLFKVPQGCFRPDISDTICDQVRFIDNVHSQVEVLRHPHVKVFVSHCGGNGVHEGIYFGKAILGIPQWIDCYDFAQRVEDAGVGLRVQQTIPTVAVDEVATKLLQLVVDEQYRLAATRLSDKMKAAGGIHRAVELIEKTMKL